MKSKNDLIHFIKNYKPGYLIHSIEIFEENMEFSILTIKTLFGTIDLFLSNDLLLFDSTELHLIFNHCNNGVIDNDLKLTHSFSWNRVFHVGLRQLNNLDNEAHFSNDLEEEFIEFIRDSREWNKKVQAQKFDYILHSIENHINTNFKENSRIIKLEKCDKTIYIINASNHKIAINAEITENENKIDIFKYCLLNKHICTFKNVSDFNQIADVIDIVFKK